ncbi:linoleate diol synthase [Russula earlei]|uniref:Linoleate diol synthase n=1 Tax=Russula earlei TaxID=71964 RepID=A0ACC0UDR8_9AGAM|nr:linoleate diol synthase [Russula earlei]
MSSRPSSKFFARGSVFNPIRSAAPASPATDNEAAVRDFQAAFKKSVGSFHEPSVLAAALDAFKHINSVDDRKMALEQVVAFLAKHADGVLKHKVHDLQNKLVELLYDDLSHPPATYIGPKYAYRNPDGSHNNICDPNMGKAHEPYARSVQQTHPLPRNMLPDAGLVFDTLLKREKFVSHPAGLSSMMFSFAALVIHTVFRTSHADVNINETSSYVDLAPLYGNNKETLDKIRVLDGRGLLFPDTFAEDRLLLLPPAVCVLLVLFNRNHNYIANKLLEINERATWTNPDAIPLEDPRRVKKLADQDEEIFQTARLINCSWFGSAIFSDYFSSILGLVRQGSTWSLNPFGEIRDLDHKLFERGRGNVCSVEFNCLYRWHATTSEADAKWVEDLLGHIFPGQSVDDLTVDDFKSAVLRIQKEEPDITHWTFGSLKRGEDGRFKDSELAAIIKNAIEHPAASFGARGTPHIMRLHEVMGIESNRRWGVCSLNEFRKFLGLKPYSSFLEWNSNPEIAEAAERLYRNIDNLELYVGLQAEEAKPVVDGAGLCPGYTISRAILSDAMALTRGDRFFTADFTPFNLTAWGFADSQRDPKGPGHGSIIGRLILRGLPGEFAENSTYTWFPLQTPVSMKDFLDNLGTAGSYSFNRPPDAPVTATAREYNVVRQILGSAQFRPSYGDKAARVISGEGFFLASNNDAESQRDQREVLRVLQSSPDQPEKIARYFYERTRKLIISKSYTLAPKGVKFVDIVYDVLRYVPLYWTATELAGLTLKADEGSSGDYTESQLYEMITDIYSFLFLDADPSKAMNLEQRVKDHISDLQRHIKANVLADVGGGLSIAGLVDTIQSLFSAKARKQKLSVAESLFANGATVDRTTNNVLSLLVGASVELSQSIINIVNYYLDQPNVVRQLKAADSKNPALEGYIYEAMRIDPPFRGVYRESLVDQSVGNLTLFKGQRVFVDLAHASHDPHVFADPKAVNVHREPRDRYLTGDGVTRSLGVELTTKIMSQVLRAVFEFDGLRRGPGLSGTLKRYKVAEVNTLRHEYLGADYLPTAWPNTMILQYDVAVAQSSTNGA